MVTMPPVPAINSSSSNIDAQTNDKSCVDCVFFVKNINTESEFIGGSVYNSVCAKKERILSNVNYSKKIQSKVYKNIASSCSEYEYNISPVSSSNDIKSTSSGTIALGIPTVEPMIVKDDNHRAGSCAFCVHRASTYTALADDYVVETTLPACSATGNLILPGNGREIAKNCPYAANQSGAQKLNITVNVGNIKMFPDMVIEIDDSETNDLNIEDPLDYETDAQVTEEDKSFGIKAWRKVYEPNGSRYIMAPIFDPESFSEDERAKIPRPGQQEHIELYRDHMGLEYRMLALWEIGFTPSLSGVSGVGKTEAFRYLAYRMQLPFERVSISNSTDIDELAGTKEYSPERGTYFEPGIIPRAWESRCVIVVDEPNVGPPEVWHFFRPLTDNSKQLVLNYEKGKRIPRNKYCYFGMAMNPVWDVRNVGTHEIGDADARRLMHIYIPPADEATERQIVMERCLAEGYKLPNQVYKSIHRISTAIREQCENDNLPFQWGTAMVIKTALASKYFDILDCFRLSIVDYIDPDSAELVMAIVRSNVNM